MTAPVPTSGPNHVLTLAFEKTATRETPVFHPWRYFVADGESLAKIEEFIADVAKVDQAREALCAKIGAKSFEGIYGFRFDFAYDDMVPLIGTERTDIHMNGGEGNEPWQSKRVLAIPDFVIADGRAYGQCHPDVSTARGREIRDAAMAIQDMAAPGRRFAKWLGAHEVAAPKDINDVNNVGGYVKSSAIATKVGNAWLIAVPVAVTLQSYADKTYSEAWATPAGAKPLTVSEYFGFFEKAGHLRNTGPVA